MAIQARPVGERPDHDWRAAGSRPARAQFAVPRGDVLAREIYLPLSQEGDDYRERYLGLELGADDYVSKGVSARELLIRIQLVLKRCWIDDK